MPFNQFALSIATGMTQQPNDHYRELQQAVQDAQWDNTSTKTPENEGIVLEQDGIGLPTYHEVEAWVYPATEASVTAQRNSGDFLHFVFRDINHKIVRGMYYQYNGDYWLVNDDNPYDGIPRNLGIRRCDNELRIIDPLNGALVIIPCCVDYDMGSPAVQISRYINTPNNHATVILQGNEETLRLCALNTRYMLDGRPFKLWSFQKSVHTAQYDIATLIYLDMYLDEIHDGDDKINQIADNGVYDYSVKLNMKDFEGAPGETAQLAYSVMLNGTEVERDVVWEYNKDVVSIDENCVMTLKSTIGATTQVKCMLKGNPDVYAICEVTIGETKETWSVTMNPEFKTLRQYESIDVELIPYRNGIAQTLSVDMLSNSDAISIEKLDKNKYRITGQKINKQVLIILKAESTFIKQRFVKVTSMMG